MNGLWIRSIWERKGFLGKILWCVLLPAAFLYLLSVELRNALYTWGWLPTNILPKPVISIGNLTVGGTGKTPSCLWLAQELARRGIKVGILSRGYRRQGSHPLILHRDGDIAKLPGAWTEAVEAGDEPSMMASIYGQLVGVGKDRFQTAREMLRTHDVDVFLLDDGFQHRRVRRNVDLLLLGKDGKGSVLPAGPFRECKKHLKRADFILVTGDVKAWSKLLPVNGGRGHFSSALEPVALVGFVAGRIKEYPLSLLYRNKILALSGIADPTGFYRMLHEFDGEIIDTLEFPDHHAYSSQDWQEISRVARRAELIVTTEKDLIKLVRFPFAKEKLLALRVAMRVKDGDILVGAIVKRIGMLNDKFAREEALLV